MSKTSAATPASGVVRILVADDNALMRAGVRVVLSANPRWEICGEAENGKEAVEKARELSPELIILDISMPVMNGIDAAREIRRIAPTIKIIILTMHESRPFELAARRAGADEIVPKRLAAVALTQAIDRLLDKSKSRREKVIPNSEGSNAELPQ